MQQFHQLIIRSLPFVGPLGIAVIIHGVWIGLSAREDIANQSLTVKPQADDRVDNTFQLIRLTKLTADRWNAQSNGLDLAATLPPPPPELKENKMSKLQQSPATQDCGQSDKQQPVKNNDATLNATETDLNRTMSSIQSSRSKSDENGNTANTDSESNRTSLPNRESIENVWRKAMGVPIWPKSLGERDQSVELKEIALSFFEPITAQELDQLEILTTSSRFKIKVINNRVLILKSRYGGEQ